MIADSIAFCARRASARSSTPSTSSTATGTTRPTRSNAYAPRPRPGRRTSRSATPTAAACRTSSPRRPRRWSRQSGDGVEVGIHTHNDAECAVANSLAAVDAGARLVQGCVNGYGERCGNANLASILPALQLKMGFDVSRAEQLASLTPTAHFLDELCNMAPEPRPRLRRPQRLRPQGRDARRRRRRRRQHLRAPRSRPGRQRARHPRLRALRQGDDPQPGRARGLELDDDAATRARSSS